MSEKARIATNIDSDLLYDFKVQVAKEGSKINIILERLIKKYLEESK